MKKLACFFVGSLIIGLLFLGIGYIKPISAAVSGVNISVERFNSFSGYASYAEFADYYDFDSSGNEYQLRSVYRVGASAETVDLNPQSGTENFTLQAKYNLFITKYNSSGAYIRSYYLMYSATTGGFGFIPRGIRTTDEGIFVFGQQYASPLTVYTASSTTTYAIGQTLANPVAVLLRYDTDMTYQNSYVLDNIVIQDAAANPNGGFYLGLALQGTVDIDFMSSGTTSYSLTNSPSTDGIFASYTTNGSLTYAYRYNSVSAAAGSDVAIDKIITNANRVYALLAFNSNTTPEEVDLDPTSGQDLIDLHEHDPAVLVFDHNGTYLWGHAVTSSDLYGSYSFLDDENVFQFAVGIDGSVYVGLYSDSDAVKIGNTTYEKTITGLANNNKYESFIYKLNSDGTVA